jgi:Plant mobile domain
MIPTLEDVAYLTGLPVRGRPVAGEERSDYHDTVVELLGEEFVAGRRRPIRYIPAGALSEAVGLRGVRRGRHTSVDEFAETVQQAIQLGQRTPEQEIRIFLLYLFGRTLFATQSTQINCKYLMLIRDFTRASRYAWGAGMLAHLFTLLPSSSSRSQSSGGFTPFLQV